MVAWNCRFFGLLLNNQIVLFFTKREAEDQKKEKEIKKENHF